MAFSNRNQGLIASSHLRLLQLVGGGRSLALPPTIGAALADLVLLQVWRLGHHFVPIKAVYRAVVKYGCHVKDKSSLLFF
jgi:hypothetical protein